ncbi:EAL domain-containing protein [Sphingomonas arantia]|uniref:EAL domain-containing protein n=1 Tax=Sphingomonas arantia TaxID=1460676 RepID=A0ABW4TW23_9SPHN
MAGTAMLKPTAVGGHNSESVAVMLARADFAFQPIVTTSSMTVHGFEALARFPEGMPTVCALLDEAEVTGTLRALDLGLVRKAITKFARFESAGATRLFCNVDNRTYGGSPATLGGIRDLFTECGLAAGNLCLEISERAPVQDSTNLLRTVEMLNGMGVRIALDDFGVGMSGLHMLLTIEPDYVKIDRAFIDQIDTSARKQAIVAKLCGLAHALGFMTVAEGVETEAEFRMARDLGCDLAQGFGIARPTTRIEDLAMSYGRSLLVSHGARMHARVEELLNPVAPMLLDAPLVDAADRFKAMPDLRVIPVIDATGSVLGALLEEDMRRYLLSDYGPALLANKGAAPRMEKLVRRFPVADANGTVEAIVNSYVAADSACGLILSDEGRYAGFLTNNAVLRLAAEAAVSAAREQNPLTQLPGNRSIAHHIGEALKRRGPQALIFFDFDNFKAFNDHYGFAAGDRALMMFADLLRKLDVTTASFVGHIGGDDFFASIAAEEPASTEIVHELCAKFASDAESLYSVRDRAAGGIHSVDRFGQNRFYPLLRTSASLLHLPAARAHLTVEMVNDQLATGKQMAKASSSGIAAVRLPESGMVS